MHIFNDNKLVFIYNPMVKIKKTQLNDVSLRQSLLSIIDVSTTNLKLTKTKVKAQSMTVLIAQNVLKSDCGSLSE